MTKPVFGLVVIGDEIISGKRQDRHLAHLAGLMAARGLRFSWVEYHGDDRKRLAATFRRHHERGDVVFSCGGIGNTPDDHTRQAAALAFECSLAVHPQAVSEMKIRFGDEITPERLLLATFPEGSSIIPNPFNRIAGFSIHSHWFVPGFPQMAWPMLEWVLDTHYREFFSRQSVVDKAFLLTGDCAYESALLDLMQDIVRNFPDLRLFSLPSIGSDLTRRHLELGVEGEEKRVNEAMEIIRQEVEGRGITWRWRDGMR